MSTSSSSVAPLSAMDDVSKCKKMAMEEMDREVICRSYSYIQTFMKLARISGAWPYRLRRMELCHVFHWWGLYSALLLIFYLVGTSATFYGIITSFQEGFQIQDSGSICSALIFFTVAILNILTSFSKHKVVRHIMEKLKTSLAARDHEVYADVKQGCLAVWVAFITNLVIMSLTGVVMILVLTTDAQSKVMLTMVAATGLSDINLTGNITEIPPVPLMIVMGPVFLAFITDYGIIFLIAACVVALKALFADLNRQIRASNYVTQELSRRHLDFTKLFQEFNGFFGHYLMYFYSEFVLLLLLYVYMIIRLSGMPEIPVYDVMLMVGFLVEALFMCISITFLMSCFQSEVNSINHDLQEKLLADHMPQSSMIITERLVSRLAGKPLVFTVNDYVDIDKPFLLTILGVFATYAVILLQLAPA